MSRELGVLLSDVQPQTVSWLWSGRIPYAKLTVLDGDPGLGKSTLALDLAARVSRGTPMPPDSEGTEAAGVVILTAEDDLADTVRPRLDAAGADVGRILAVEEVPGQKRPPAVPDDVAVVEEAVLSIDAKLLIIDPLMAFLSDSIDGHKDQSVRRALHLLADLAERTRVAILVVRHLNKSGSGNPMYRGGGSIGIIGAARSGLLVARDPENESRRVLASTKCNLASTPASLAFHLDDTMGVARVLWDGVSGLSARELLAASGSEVRSKADEARDFLADVLAPGPMSTLEVMRRASEQGIAEKTLRRAKKDLVVVEQVPGAPHDGWRWRLRQMATPATSFCDGHLTAACPSDGTTSSNPLGRHPHGDDGAPQVATPEGGHLTSTDEVVAVLEAVFPGSVEVPA